MSLLNTINNDMKESMKNHDTFTLNVIRMAKGAIQLEAINKKKELTDEDIIMIVSKQIKMRRDSIQEFAKAGRNDLVEQNEKEIEILSKYMPEQLTDEEIDNIIEETFNKVNPTSNKDMGLIMKEISPKIKGKADMGLVNTKIRERLSNL